MGRPAAAWGVGRSHRREVEDGTDRKDPLPLLKSLLLLLLLLLHTTAYVQMR